MRPPKLASFGSSLLPVLLLWLVSTPVARAADSVAVENGKPGTTDWKLTNPRCESCTPDSIPIQGYASRTSVNQGEPIDFFVRTAVPGAYTMKIFRIGWYGGAGGRLVGALKPDGTLQLPQPDGTIAPALVPQLSGFPQAIPVADADGLIECSWTPATTNPLAIPADWTSGVYLAKLETVPDGVQSYIIFVVRDDGRPSPHLFISSVATFLAYNNWGGRSTYSTPMAHRVSFNRPYGADYDGDQGAGHFLLRENNMVRWMERQGYDVTYATDVDLHERPDLAIGHRSMSIVGHSEYWSWQMRANAERARERGVSLGFFSGNTVFWQVRFEPSAITGQPDRTMVAYKIDALTQDPLAIGGDPSKLRYTTALWSGNLELALASSDPINLPEEMLVGVGYSPSTCDPIHYHFADITVTDPASWPSWLSQSTGLSANAPLPNMLGYEVDRMHGFQPNGTVDVAHSLFPAATDCPTSPQSHVFSDVAEYTAPSGAVVLASGSIFWDLGLDDYGMNPGDVGLSKGVVPAAQQMTANFLTQALQVAPVPASDRLAATVSASSEALGFPASNAGDGNPLTLWMASAIPGPSNNNAWIQLDFGVRRWIGRVRWQGATGGTADSPTDYSLQVSDDAIRWQTVIAKTNPAMVVQGNEPLNAQGRYLRLVTTKVGTGGGLLGLGPAGLGFYEFWAEGAPPPPSGRLRTVGVLGGVLNRVQEASTTYSIALGSDLDFTTQWVASLTPSPDNNSGWYELDFGSRRQIDRVRWLGASGSPPLAASPTNYSIFVSDDGASWTDVLDRTNGSMVVNGNEPMSAQGRYVLISTSQVGTGAGESLSFFEFWAEGSDSDNVLGAVAAASSEAPGYPASNAVDGSSSTQWIASLVASPSNNAAWFQLDFGTRKQIDRVRWHAGTQNPYPASAPTDYSIQVSDDGSTWQTVLTRNGNPRPVIDGDELLNAQGRYLRIATTKVNDGTGWALAFYEFWAEGY
jgi:F5/8 type C domain